MDFLSDSKKKKQFYLTYSVFLINGMLALSIGSLLPFIRDAKGLDYAFCGLIVSLHSVGNLISSFGSGILAPAIGRKRSILCFDIFFVLAYILILIAENRIWIAIAFFMTGLARGATSNFCNTIINNLAPGKAAIINGLHAMFSIGAFLFPIILMLFVSSNAENWMIASGFMLIMGAISFLIYCLIPLEEEKGVKKKGGNLDFFKAPLFYICTAILFFYLCAEQGVIGWMVTYFKDTGLIDSSMSQITASVLWIMILFGRLTAAVLSTKFDKKRLLVIMSFGMLIFFLILIFTTNPIIIFIGIMGFGFSMAGIYPTTVSFSGKLIQKYSACWSFMLTAASMGSIIMPSVIGKIAESAGIYVGMSSILVVLVIDLVCILLLNFYEKKY